MFNYRLFLIIPAVGMLGACSIVRSSNSTEVVNSANVNTSSNAQPEAGSGKTQLDQQIRKVDFKNFTYEPSCAGEDLHKVTVKNGEFSREKKEDGYVDRFYFNVF